MTQESNVLVSVVTPIYNTEGYIEECIRSVLAQTYANFEYLLIDNHSTDRSAAIAADYAARDARIKLISPPRFLGQADNFNFALSQVHPNSRYTKMVLSDDWIFPTCLASMTALAEGNPSVGIVGGYWLVEARGDGFGLPVERSVLSGTEACRMHLIDGIYLFGTPSTVMYRSDIVRARTPFFRSDRVFFDTDATFEILAHHDFGFVHQVLSFCRDDRPGSLSEHSRNFRAAALDRLVLVKNHGRTFLSEAEHRFCSQGAERFFYDGLAREWLSRPAALDGGGFWKFQREGLETAGERVKVGRLARAVARVVAKGAASPLELAKALRGKPQAPRE